MWWNIFHYDEDSFKQTYLKGENIPRSPSNTEIQVAKRALNKIPGNFQVKSWTL